MPDLQLSDELRGDAKSAWYRYLELLLPFRPELHAYCRALTGDVWDAEDLVQDTLLKGFAILGSVNHRIDSPRAYLVRIATNLWIDTQRRRGYELSMLSVGAGHPPQPSSEASPALSSEMRDAAATLLGLAPRERAAVLMKDVLEMDLKEIAAVLTTTVGAVKAALHRGRARLRDSETVPAIPSRSTASRMLVDRFIDCYNSRDLPGLLALMLDNATIELFGFDLEAGRDKFERPGGWFHHNFYGPPGWPVDQPFPARWESTVFRDEVIALVFGPTFEIKEVLQSVMRFDEEDDRIARIRVYATCPETVGEVGKALNLATNPNPYQGLTMILSILRAQKRAGKGAKADA